MKERLRSRGICVDTTCSSYNEGPEDIGHVLFRCRFSHDVWAQSSVPMPPSGTWSHSVVLILHHLISCSKKSNQTPEQGLIFPWNLWHIWKARNSFCFEHVRLDPAVILDKATTEAEIWRNIQTSEQSRVSAFVAQNLNSLSWSKSPESWVKCNIASSWVPTSNLSGGAWVVRDAAGSVVFILQQLGYYLVSSSHLSSVVGKSYGQPSIE